MLFGLIIPMFLLKIDFLQFITNPILPIDPLPFNVIRVSPSLI